MDDNSIDIGLRSDSDLNNYTSGQVMLATVLILTVVCIIVAFFHMYSRWYLLHRSTTYQHHSTTTTTTTTATTTVVTAPQLGLNAALFKSLPTFIYSRTATTTASLDCAICLSDFEELEVCRILPKCNHCFHLECIDMWFHSHTNCPLCRSTVHQVSEQSQLTESSVGDTPENLTVIVEVPVTTTERETDVVPVSESAHRFKVMVGPIRSLRRFFEHITTRNV